MVLEPLVQGAAGMLVTDPGSVRRVVEAAQARDVLVIADEVATGMGRTGTLFACEQCDVQPDLLVIGKGLTGGYLPLSATAASRRVYDAFLGPDLSESTFYHGHSYSGNALACAVALRHLRAARRVGRAGQRGGPLGTQLADRLAAQIEPLPAVAQVRRPRADDRRRAGPAGRGPALGPAGVRRGGGPGGAAATAR